MKIGIITQPLASNYGGILQNYALQQVLKRMGHEVWTIDYNTFNWVNWLDNAWRVVAHKLLGHQAKFAPTPYQRLQQEKPLRNFALKHINLTTPRTHRYERSIVRKYGFDAIVVGSDQVWRPQYNYKIEDSFLQFVKGMPLKRVAYAASFGTDEWEFSPRQTLRCRALAKQFDAISVRETSGIRLCKEYLGVDANQVIDPTLLLQAEDYIQLCKDIPQRKPFVFAYILDQSKEKLHQIKQFAAQRGFDYFIKSADASISEDDSIELWLSYFRDAAYVITDSFHGTAFAVNFNKDFYVFGNASRGNSRFESLLSAFQLQERMIGGEIPQEGTSIDWGEVNALRESEVERALKWLKKNQTNLV